ncbi:hypothetical protein BDA96_03G264000 [Sorghum bicolor]|uniref:Uncharacterized protein n=2 Tax=Sorghum bicolor TaxID=4558 RepID=A0A1B6Q569_SORBI|nr:hypothetical protein BDA96_03G264000 [Sorghum bicolor]KXG33035.1 hypothetical protein SORBI_3003G243800 [Sorghum bicolor]
MPTPVFRNDASLPKQNAQSKIDRWDGEDEAAMLRVLGSKAIVMISYGTKCGGYHTKNNIFLVIAQHMFMLWYYFVLKKRKREKEK